MPPLHLYARVRVSLCNLHTRPRVQRAPGIPCSLFEGECFANLGQIMPREGGPMSAEHRHCERSEAIHFAAQRKNGLLRCARNDVDKSVSRPRRHPMEIKLLNVAVAALSPRRIFPPSLRPQRAGRALAAAKTPIMLRAALAEITGV